MRCIKPWKYGCFFNGCRAQSPRWSYGYYDGKHYLDGVTSNIQTQLSAAGGASDINGVSDALVESGSIYIGSDPSSTTDNAR